MPRRSKKPGEESRCPRCKAETKRLVRCSVCHDEGCEEACVPNGDGTICVRCAGPGADEGGLDDPEPGEEE